ncbi:MAG: DinB family protein [Chitinophagaceae bacterium]|nr:DinB family protein [Chitinophagaceae bacterium]
MSLIQDLVLEIEQEHAGTRKMLERVPADKFDWRPHEKSMTLKALATHIANLSRMVGLIATTDSVDLADGSMKAPEITSAEDLVKLSDRGAEESVEALKTKKEEDLRGEWTMKFGDRIIMKMPKAQAMRAMGMSHLYHHRAQLGMYLRLLDVPIPGMYGPSADDKA